MPDVNSPEWDKWSKHLILTLEKLETNQGEIYEKLNALVVEIAILKTKASMAGGVAGSITALAVSVMTAFIVHIITKG